MRGRHQCVTFEYGRVFVTCVLSLQRCSKKGFSIWQSDYYQHLAFRIPLKQLFKRLSASLRAISDSTAIKSLNASPYLPPPQTQCEHRLLWPNENEWTVSGSVNTIRLVQHSYSGNGLTSTNLKIWQTAESSHTGATISLWCKYYLCYTQAKSGPFTFFFNI